MIPLLLWQMALYRATPATSGNGARIHLGNEAEDREEGSQPYLPPPPKMPLDLAQVLANQTVSLKSSPEVWKISIKMEEDHMTRWESS